MDFTTFCQLYDEVPTYADKEDLYIMERGWQRWMDSYSADMVAAILRRIYALYNGGFDEVSKSYPFPAYKLISDKFKIPYSTIQKWSNNVAQPADYVLRLMSFAVITDFITTISDPESNN